jgi:hypothetical protein
MHPTIIFIQNKEGQITNQANPINTKLSFTPELNTTIYHKGLKATVMKVIIDVTPILPAIIIHAQLI